MTPRRTKFYLDKRNARWSGVCSGIAEYTGFDVTWVRVGAVLVTILGAFPWTLIAYWITAWVASDQPSNLYDDADERKFWQGVRQSPARTTRDVRSRFRDLERRLADVEDHYTSGSSNLARQIDELK